MLGSSCARGSLGLGPPQARSPWHFARPGTLLLPHCILYIHICLFASSGGHPYWFPFMNQQLCYSRQIKYFQCYHCINYIELKSLPPVVGVLGFEHFRYREDIAKTVISLPIYINVRVDANYQMALFMN